MNSNLIKWVNEIYLLIQQSFLFWVGILMNGIFNIFIEAFKPENGNTNKIKQTKFSRLLSIVWLLLLINVFLSSSLYLFLNNFLLNVLSYITFLIFLVITTFVTWFAYLSSNITELSNTKIAILAFHSGVRYWISSLSFILILLVSVIISHRNIFFLIFFIPGIYIKVSKLFMKIKLENIKETSVLFNN